MELLFQSAVEEASRLIGLNKEELEILSDAFVSREDPLGPEGKGLPVAYSALLNGRIGIGSAIIKGFATKKVAEIFLGITKAVEGASSKAGLS